MIKLNAHGARKALLDSGIDPKLLDDKKHHLTRIENGWVLKSSHYKDKNDITDRPWVVSDNGTAARVNVNSTVKETLEKFTWPKKK